MCSDSSHNTLVVYCLFIIYCMETLLPKLRSYLTVLSYKSYVSLYLVISLYKPLGVLPYNLSLITLVP